MRDGICLFMSGRSANYERLGDHEAEFTMIETKEQAEESARAYLDKQQRIVNELN